MAYVLLTAVLLGLLFNARGPWWTKAAAIIVGSIFYIVPYASWPTLLGWPTIAELPPNFNLLGMYVQPPDQLTGSNGVIYLWASERKENGAHGTPRAYQFGYSVKRREQMIQAGEKAKRGIPQAGKLVEDEDAPAGRVNFGRRLGQKSTRIEFYDAPAPQLPDK